MSFRTALDNLNTIQAALTITDPVTAGIKRVYQYVPKEISTIPDGHSWLNRWELIEHQRQPSRRIDIYVVTSELFVKESDLDRAADIATAFHEALLDALDADVTLGGTLANAIAIKGLLADVTWAGRDYPGLRETLELHIAESKTFA